MEKGIIAEFKNLESIYPSLYDLFNQNFLIQDNKKYARIAIGSSNNKPYKVDDKFKSIIIVDEKDIYKEIDYKYDTKDEARYIRTEISFCQLENQYKNYKIFEYDKG